MTSTHLVLDLSGGRVYGRHHGVADRDVDQKLVDLGDGGDGGDGGVVGCTCRRRDNAEHGWDVHGIRTCRSAT